TPVHLFSFDDRATSGFYTLSLHDALPILYGARRRSGQEHWSAPFVLADTPGFPDCNTAMFIDGQNRLWLFWPIILANTWESCVRSEEHTSELQSRRDLVCRLLLEKKKKTT